MRALVKFFLITFAVTWTCGFAAMSLPREPGILVYALMMIGTFAPALVGIALTRSEEGPEAVRSLVGRVLQTDVALRWYVFAVAFMPAIKLAVAVTHYGIRGTWPQVGAEPWYLFVMALFISTPVQSGEEIGWRGYALPRLSKQFGLRGASLTLGIIWGVWHLPYFLVPGVDNYRQSFPVFVLGVTAISVAFAWLYAKTKGSLLLTMLMHSAVNQTTAALPGAIANATNPFGFNASLTAWLTVMFLWLTAIPLLRRMDQTSVC